MWGGDSVPLASAVFILYTVPLETTASLDHNAIKKCICNSMKTVDLNNILVDLEPFT